MNFKKIILIVILLILIIGILILMTYSNDNKNSNEKLNIAVTNFATYDFVRQIAGDNVNLTFLLGPGIDSHSYEPTTKDLITIQEADMFIYIGGELERWVDKVLETSDLSNVECICLKNMVELKQEKEVDGAEHEHHDEHDEEFAYNEHIWTSPANAKIMIEKIAEKISEKDLDNKNFYITNAENYNEEITKLQKDIQDIVDNKVRNKLVFGDKMPMQYFLDEFGLEASAAFNGCSTETEPSSTTLTYLIEKVKDEKIPVVLYIELSTGQVANTIAEEAGVGIMQIQTLHNVSKNDFENGETYVSLMRRNLDVLRKALQ